MLSRPNPLLVLLVKGAILMFELLSRLLRYIRLKGTVSLLRFSFWWRAGWPKASPDSIVHIPSRDARRTIKAHVYQSWNSVQKRAPILINFHGSGFVLPLHGDDDMFCRKVSSETGRTVFDVQYRLAPENPWPAAIHDAEDVVNWILQQSDRFDTANISLSGFSAGANLSLVQAALNFPKATFRSLVCFYPPTDLFTGPEDKIASMPDPTGKPIPPAVARLFNSCYIPPGSDTRDPRISPLYAPVDTYPQNVLIISCARDSLCSEAEAVAAKLDDAGGRNVVRRRMDECDHGWDKAVKKGSVQERARDEAYDLAVQMLNL